MKDIQGYNRGKCNSCECLEYRQPPVDTELSSGKPMKLRCEYCNHTPVEHVWLMELGECRKCGADNCDKYESEESNCYTDCGYCGCSPNDHKGAEKLRKKSPTAAVVPRVDASSNPVQSFQNGLCTRPGCGYPKRMEKGHLHDYCSRTCARLDQTSSSQPTPKVQSSLNHQSVLQSTSAMTAGSGAGPPLTSTSSTSPLPMQCKNCNRKPANQGHIWCSDCFAWYEAQKKQ